jgi:hypothetical protein
MIIDNMANQMKTQTDHERKERNRLSAAKWRAANPEKAKAAAAAYRAANPEKVKASTAAWQLANPQKRQNAAYKWRNSNPEKVKASQAAYRAANPEKSKNRRFKWIAANPEKYKAIQANYQKKRRLTDPFFAMSCRLRARLRSAFKNGGFKKHSCTEKMLGCSFKEFSKHIESQFTEGMSWDNRSEWHLDHIVPLSCATTIEGIEKLSHYTNIRPLWAADNLSKSDNLVLI